MSQPIAPSRAMPRVPSAVVVAPELPCAHIRDAHARVPLIPRWQDLACSRRRSRSHGVLRRVPRSPGPHRRSAVSACGLAICFLAWTHARSGASSPVMNWGGGGEKPFQKTSAKGAERILAGAFLSRARATYRSLKEPSPRTGQLSESPSGSWKGPDKGFPEGVARSIADLRARRRGRTSSRLLQGIEQPAAQYAASRAHAGLQQCGARQLEAFHGEDVPATST